MIYKGVLDSLPFGVIITDKTLHVTAVNRWVIENRLQEKSNFIDCLITDLFPEIAERGLGSIYELVLDSKQRITLSNRIHRYFLKIPSRRGSGFKNMQQTAIVSPFFDGETLIGTITIINNVEEQLFTEKAFFKEIDRLSVLHHVDQVLANLDINASLDVIKTKILEHFNAISVAIFLDENKKLELAAQLGKPINPSILDLSLAFWCFENKRSNLFNYLKNKGPFSPLTSDADCEFAAPLLIGEKCLGVIQVCVNKERKYDKYDLALLEGMAARAAISIHNARLHQESEYWRLYYQHTNEHLQTLLNAMRLMNKNVELDEIFNSLSELLIEVFGIEYVVYFKRDFIDGKIDPISISGDERLTIYDCSINQKLAEKYYSAHGNLKNFTDLSQVSFLTEEYQRKLSDIGLCRQISIGLFVRGKLIGILQLLSANKERTLNFEENELLGAIGTQLSLTIENADLFKQQQKLAETDGLTGVNNRRSFDLELSTWIERTRRYNQTVSLIIMDIDDFKNINDSFGHQTGDDVLKLLAEMVVKSVRNVDIVARYGGEEFVVILPDTDQEEAIRTAERLRIAAMELLKNAQNPLLRKEKFSISLGVATAPKDTMDAYDLIKIADQRLYGAKWAGKNNIVSSQ